TTTSDALWAGLPVISLAGGHFASRVSASILAAAALPDLVTNSLADYEALAARLATDRTALAALRAPVGQAREGSPLFDCARVVANLERAYQAMWRRFNTGQPPEAFAVEEPA